MCLLSSLDVVVVFHAPHWNGTLILRYQYTTMVAPNLPSKVESGRVRRRDGPVRCKLFN